MKCDELLLALNDYVDGTLDPAICQSFQSHLEGCNPCQVVIDNIRQSITLYKANGAVYALPAEFSSKLHQHLREQWKKKFPSAL